MKIKILISILFGIFILTKPSFSAGKLNVFVSITPQAFFVESIGGDKVDVSVMIPPGGNPHTYEPTPSQLTKLSKSLLYVKVGSGVEFELEWMDKLASLNKRMRICDSSKGVKLISMDEHDHEEEGNDDDEHHHEHTGNDPHIWLSPNNAIIMAMNIKEALINIDPENKDYYQQKTTELIMQLDDLKREVNTKLADLSSRTFLIFHPAWGYFASDFNLNQIAAEHMGKEPSPKQLMQVINQAKKLNIKVIFASPQFDQKSAKVIANEIKGTVELIDPLSKDYFNNLRKAANAFKKSM